VKLSVIMPTIDVPIGSGHPAPTLSRAVETVLNGGHDNVELLLGTDSKLPEVEEMFRGDRRVVIRAYALSRSYGNYQRHWLQREATGDMVLFMDHDDGFAPGGLGMVAEDAATFPGRPLFYASSDGSVVSRHHADVTDVFRSIVCDGRGNRLKASVEHLRGPRRRLNPPAAFSSAIPRVDGLPVWPITLNRWADVDYMADVWSFFEERGAPPVFSPSPLGVRRPWGRNWPDENWSLIGAMSA